MDRLIGVWALIFIRPLFVAGIIVAAAGAALLLFAASYFALGAFSEADLDDLTVTQDETGLTNDDLTRGLATPEPSATPPATATPSTSPALVSSPSPAAPVPTAASESPQSSPMAEESDAAEAEPTEQTHDSLYDEYGIFRDFSHYLSEADDGALLFPIAENFRSVTADELLTTYGEQPRPQHIIIPAIGLNSTVVGLNIVWDGDTTAWETADHAVGFHIGSATPGEIGNTVLSGHVNSPFAGEGSIFARLDEIAPLLRRGEIVDILVQAGGDVFLYRATDTTVMLPENVDVFDYSAGPTLSLVTCAPATTFSHRFIVNATLVGIARL